MVDAPGPFTARAAFRSTVVAEFVPRMPTVDGAAPFRALEERPVGLVLHRVRFEARRGGPVLEGGRGPRLPCRP